MILSRLTSMTFSPAGTALSFLVAGSACFSVDGRAPSTEQTQAFGDPSNLAPAPGTGGSGSAPPGGAGSSSDSAANSGGANESSTGVVTRLAFDELTSATLVNTPLPRFTVTLEDDEGRVVRRNGERVGLVLEDGPSGAQLVGFPSTETRNGVARFDAVGLDRAGTYRLSAAAMGLKVEAAVSIEVAAAAFVNVATNLPRRPVHSVLAATHEILYASTDRGVFRSDNVGLSWQPASFGVRGEIGALLATSSGRDLVYAIAANSFEFLGRTLNRGETWRSLLAPAFDTGQVRDVALDARRPSAAWACGDSGVYQTEDSGDHWVATSFQGSCGAIVFGGPAPGALFAYQTEGLTRKLLKSDTDGATWQTLLVLDNELTGLFAFPNGAVFRASAPALERSDNGGATWSSALVDVRNLVSSPADPLRMYGTTGKFVRVSVDGGSSFNEGTSLLPWDVHDLSVDPTDAMRVYAATSGGLRVSTDGGSSWGAPSTSLGGALDVVVHPTVPGRVLATGDSGLYQSDDSGDSWRLQTGGPAASSHLSFDPDDSSVAYACGGGFHESRDGGGSWTQLAMGYGCDALAIAGATFWIADNDGVQRSVDGGVSWTRTALDRPTYTLAADRDGMTVYASTNAGTFKSSDAGASWLTMVSTDRAEALVIDPQRPSRLWGGMCTYPSDPLRVSLNSGDTWSSLTTFPGLADSCVSDVTFGSSGALYVLGDQLYVSRDAGSTWSASSLGGVDGFLDRSFAVSPDESTFFVATDLGMFRSVSSELFADGSARAE
ncbi:MAG TPA: hypothetical protein VJU61_26480 [Polyangiaceae bacterium]|nr:hypothetical protein [Polyangiaceae bacterium]